MGDKALKKTIRALLAEVHSKLEEATAIAKSAECCAEDGNVIQALRILMDFEDSAHQAQDLFKAALTINRILLPNSS